MPAAPGTLAPTRGRTQKNLCDAGVCDRVQFRAFEARVA